MKRIARENETLEKMIKMYCKGHHPLSEGEALCFECKDLLQFSKIRNERCPFGEKKPACSECRIHCYPEDYKKRIQKVMRFSGPKMIFESPYLALRHLLDKYFFH